MIGFILIFACAAFVAVLLMAERRGNQRMKWFAKPAASMCFVLIALLGAGPTSFAYLIIAGLVFCLIGDLLLIPQSKKTFLLGMGAFALGHCAYIAAFLTVSAGVTMPMVLAGLFMTGTVFFMLRWLWGKLAEFKWPVTVYSIIIAIMVATSFAAAPHGFPAPYWPIAVGALEFAISDISVARDQFIKRDYFNRLWGLPLYYAGQMLIASSV
jgi:uncharacterized membrane protein YhhN